MEARIMMTLEMFREHVLKGKSVEELYDLIEDFKIEQAFLKVKIEEKNIGDFTLPPQDMVAKINKYRLYIRDTYIKIKSIGGEIKRSDEEEFASKFQKNLFNIKEIKYGIDRFFDGHDEYQFVVEPNQMTVTKTNSQEDSFETTVIDKEKFMKELGKLYIGEWRESYSDGDYGALVRDGTGWSLTIHYSGEMKSVEFTGSNAFPYNIGRFDRLCRKAFDK